MLFAVLPATCFQVRKELRACKLHVDADVTDRKMQKKVREAQLAQYNYILVVGEQEKVSAAQAWQGMPDTRRIRLLGACTAARPLHHRTAGL